MTELETRILTAFRKLDRNDQQVAIHLAVLVICYPDFSAAVKAVTPAGASAPDWEVTKRLVAKWMAEEGVRSGQTSC